MSQTRQEEWHEQWSLLEDNEEFLFRDWIYPIALQDFTGKDVLECGCGGGQHTKLVASLAAHVTAVDLNTTDIARKRTREFDNIDFIEADIATMRLEKRFDIVFSIGVIHHTDDPDATVANMVRHVREGGQMVVWVYSKEGNALVEYGIEPVRKYLLRGLSRRALLGLSRCLTAIMYLPIYTLYMLPLTFLPFYEYFKNFRKLSFERNVLNVFDKLNAPQVEFISKERITRWFAEGGFEDVQITPYCGVSWRGSGTKC